MFFKKLLGVAFKTWTISACNYHIQNYANGNTDKVSRTLHDVAKYVLSNKKF